jgi:Mg2+ and Co2+ transporter CorA
MKTSKDIKKKESAISEEDKKTLQTIMEDIKFIVEKTKLDEELLRKLTNISSTLSVLKENYTWRILRALKQNHMLD